MAAETLLAQIIHDDLSISKRETSLAVCCVCDLLRDETKDFLEGEHWVTRHTYWKTYGVDPIECCLTLTCCPRCSPSERHHEDREILGGSGAA